MKKRGYFFTLDAFIAVTVLTTGMLMILNTHNFVPYSTQTLYLCEGYIDTLGSVKIYELSSPYIYSLRLDGNITNPDQTALEQLGEFHFLGKRAIEGNFTKNITSSLIPSQYGFELLINGTKIYNQSIIPNSTSLLVSSKRIISGVINRSVFWTFEAEMRVWQE